MSDPALAPRRSYTTSKRSPARLTAAVVAVVAVLVIALVLILSKAGGSSSTASSAHSTAARKAAAATHAHRAHARRSAPGGSRAAASTAAAAGETNVVVLNGTGTEGVAHRVSGELRGDGYSQATPLAGRPPGANQVTVVEYANGHRADAEGVARSLGVSQAQPIEATVASLSGSATVVVIVGLDKAATVP